MTVLLIILLVAVTYYSSTLYRTLRKERRKHLEELADRYVELRKARADAVKKSKSVINGKVLETVSPYLPNFPVEADDINFLGNPIDFVLFKDTAEEQKCSIHFVEVKTGTSRLSKKQKNIKKAIQEGRIKWHEYKIKN